MAVFCLECASRRKTTVRVSECHPDIPHMARGLCRKCYNVWQQERHGEARRARSRKRYREQTELCKKLNRKARLKEKFGITLEQYDALLNGQNGCCAICLAPQNPERRHAVDHCHETGAIRGLLCDKCNRGIAAFGDSYESLALRLARALDYLRKSLPYDPLRRTA
jgi:hypothetical protein